MPTVPDLNGVNGPQNDKPLSKPNRTTAGMPTTPQYSGELVLDSTTGQVWSGSGTGTGVWTPVFIVA